MKKLIILFLFSGLLASCSTTNPPSGDNKKDDTTNPSSSSSPAPIASNNPSTPSSPTAPQNIKEGFRISFGGKEYELEKVTDGIELISYNNNNVNQLSLNGSFAKPSSLGLITILFLGTGPLTKGFKPESVDTGIVMKKVDVNYQNSNSKQKVVFTNTSDKVEGYFEGDLISGIGTIPVKIQFNLPFPVKK